MRRNSEEAVIEFNSFALVSDIDRSSLLLTRKTVVYQNLTDHQGEKEAY